MEEHQTDSLARWCHIPKPLGVELGLVDGRREYHMRLHLGLAIHSRLWLDGNEKLTGVAVQHLVRAVEIHFLVLAHRS